MPAVHQRHQQHRTRGIGCQTLARGGQFAIQQLQMRLCFRFAADTRRQRAQRIARSGERFAVAAVEVEAHDRRDALEFFRRRAVAVRAEDQRGLQLGHQLQIGFGAQPDVHSLWRQRRLADPDVVVARIGDRQRRDAERQQQLGRQPLQRNNTLLLRQGGPQRQRAQPAGDDE